MALNPPPPSGRPPRQHVITSFPLTTHTSFSPVTSPSRPSPTSTFSPADPSHSLQATPDGLQPVSQPFSEIPTPLSLHEAAMASGLPPSSSSNSPPPSAMADAVAMGRSPGLIRRISRGAQNRLTRRRPSASKSNRDHSCGPVIMRRRSESRQGAGSMLDDNFDISEMELDDDVIDDCSEVMSQDNPLGIIAGRSSADQASEAGTGPVISSILQQGTHLTKVTKKKRKLMNFRLDFESAKVSWDASRQSKQFYIDDVREIRKGDDARHYREEFQVSEECAGRWFTIIYSDPDRSKGRTMKTMHLIAPDDFSFHLWTSTLDSVSRSRIDLMAGLAGNGEKSMRALWRREMNRKFGGRDHSEADERMDLAEVKRVCRGMHINTSESTIDAQFDRVDTARTGSISYAQFDSFVRLLKEREDVRRIFNDFRPDSMPEMDKDAFFRFLTSAQGEDVEGNLQYWTGVFERFARGSRSKADSQATGEESVSVTMNLQGLQNFLSSTANPALVTSSTSPLLDKPLNEYFISSSHNTYLLGRQVAGQSSTEAYINALQKGCRCVEIDCWDGPDGRPIVVHGRTLTTSVLFADCVAVIAKYAFFSSPYPLIISLEVHCNPEQQAAMVEIMTKQFGDQLLLAPLNDSQILPSPEELKYKILIKVKAPQELEESAVLKEVTNVRRLRSASSPSSRPTVSESGSAMGSSLVSSPASPSPTDTSVSFWSTTRGLNTPDTTPHLPSSAEESDDPKLAEVSRKLADKREKRKKSNITKVLGDLGVYTRGIKYYGFASAEARTYNHVFSFNEKMVENICNKDMETRHLLEKHNMRYFMRVYPHGLRVNSGNFDPINFWRRGVQMAAMNWQTFDLGAQINKAMFAAGPDRTGYVLKPKELRESLDLDDFTIASSRKPRKKLVKFSIDIISAQQLPRPRGLGPDANINPYVECEIYSADDKRRGSAPVGEPGPEMSSRKTSTGTILRKRTQIVPHNGYNPLFKEQLSMTLETQFPSLIFVRWSVWNSPDGTSSGNVPLATFTAKLSSLQKGYRHLPLFDANGEQYLFSSLFCKIAKEEPVTIESANDWSHSFTGEPWSPFQAEARSPNFFGLRRLLSRQPSERRRKDSREGSENASFTRSSTLEK